MRVPEVKRVSMWSGPRNISTALMYSFRQRPDTQVLDEPLYGHYLRVTGAPHPGAAEVMAAMDTDGGRVVREVILGPCDQPVLFIKNMAHHLTGLERGFLGQLTNILLTRHPAEMLTSLAKQLPAPSLRDTGLREQTELLDILLLQGGEPVVLEAGRVLRDPEGTLRALCDRLGLGFCPAMLHWEPGPKPEDGVWARYWYGNVHASSGFAPYIPKTEPAPPALTSLLEACMPLYERLATHSI